MMASVARLRGLHNLTVNLSELASAFVQELPLPTHLTQLTLSFKCVPGIAVANFSASIAKLAGCDSQHLGFPRSRVYLG